MNPFAELNSLQTPGQRADFVAKCLDRLQREKAPEIAHVLALLLEWHDSELGGQFAAAGFEPDSKVFYKVAFAGYIAMAEHGSAEAARAVAVFYQVGTFPVSRDQNAFLEWLRRAAALGDSQAPLEIALHERSG